ncbi:MAG TPA: transcriptional regulator [Actinobacteria bacterium]|nr:transcriptional regulator [Actinomycetota bacterium]
MISTSAEHPTRRLDDVIHQRVRFGILAVLTEADRADFQFLKERLGLTDGNLSRHLQVLAEAGFVAVTKTFEGRRPRTWVRATSTGRSGFNNHLVALQEIIDQTKAGTK